MKKTSKKPGYVYLIRCASGFYKIGRSKNPEKRCEDLDTGHEHLDLIHKIATDDMPRLEGSLHKRFHKGHLRGEWFDLSEDDVAAICGIHIVYFKDKLAKKYFEEWLHAGQVDFLPTTHEDMRTVCDANPYKTSRFRTL